MGAGRWGINVVRTLGRDELVDLAWVADPDPDARERAAAVSPSSRVCPSVEHALDDVDAVAICTPAVDHFEHAREIIAAGKHALVEKPMATTAEDARRLIELADRAGATLMVGHQLLFHPLFTELEGAVGSNRLGRLLEIRAERTGTVDFDSEPGVLWAYGPHDVSMILALTDDLPDAVSATGEIDRASGRVGRAEITLRFPSGLVAGIRLNGVSETRVRRLTLVGEHGRAVFDDAEAGGRLAIEGGDPREFPPDAARRFAPLERSCRHFVASVLDGTPARTGGEHGRLVTRLLERAAAEVAAASAEAGGRAEQSS